MESMIKEKNKITKLNIRSTFFEFSFATFLFFLFISISVFSQSVCFDSINHINKYTNKQTNSFNSGKGYIKQFQNNLPLDLTPKSNEKELSNENELIEDTNDNLNYLNYLSAYNNFKITIGINFYLHQLTQSLQNGTSIALFVLHHSWKSFLFN